MPWSAQTQDALTDSSGGVAATTIVAIGATNGETDRAAEINANFASFAVENVKVKTDVGALRTTVAGILTALKAAGYMTADA